MSIAFTYVFRQCFLCPFLRNFKTYIEFSYACFFIYHRFPSTEWRVAYTAVRNCSIPFYIFLYRVLTVSGLLPFCFSLLSHIPYAFSIITVIRRYIFSIYMRNTALFFSYLLFFRTYNNFRCFVRYDCKSFFNCIRTVSVVFCIYSICHCRFFAVFRQKFKLYSCKKLIASIISNGPGFDEWWIFK